MKIILLSVAFVFLGMVAFVLWRYIATGRASENLQNQLMAELQPVWSELYAGRDPSPEVVSRFAQDPRTRTTLLDLLLFHKKLSLFPNNRRTPEALAEGQMVRWLMHPNELGCAPSEIELSSTLTVKDARNRDQQWMVFKFCMQSPHWAAVNGWVAGVVGPVSVNEVEPFPNAPVVFSMFKGFDTLTPQGHVEACLKQVGQPKR